MLCVRMFNCVFLLEFRSCWNTNNVGSGGLPLGEFVWTIKIRGRFGELTTESDRLKNV